MQATSSPAAAGTTYLLTPSQVVMQCADRLLLLLAILLLLLLLGLHLRLLLLLLI